MCVRVQESTFLAGTSSPLCGTLHSATPSKAPSFPQHHHHQAPPQGHFDATMQLALSASLQQAQGRTVKQNNGGGWGGVGAGSERGSFVDLTADSETHGKQPDDVVVCLDSEEEDEAVVCLDDADDDDEGELQTALRMSMEGGGEPVGGSAASRPLPVHKATLP